MLTIQSPRRHVDARCEQSFSEFWIKLISFTSPDQLNRLITYKNSIINIMCLIIVPCNFSKFFKMTDPMDKYIISCCCSSAAHVCDLGFSGTVLRVSRSIKHDHVTAPCFQTISPEVVRFPFLATG